MSTPFRAALSVTMSKRVIPWKCSVEGESELESDERIGQALGGPAIEVVAKGRASGSRGVQAEDRPGGRRLKEAGRVGALLRREELYFFHLTT